MCVWGDGCVQRWMTIGFIGLRTHDDIVWVKHMFEHPQHKNPLRSIASHKVFDTLITLGRIINYNWKFTNVLDSYRGTMPNQMQTGLNCADEIQSVLPLKPYFFYWFSRITKILLMSDQFDVDTGRYCWYAAKRQDKNSHCYCQVLCEFSVKSI